MIFNHDKWAIHSPGHSHVVFSLPLVIVSLRIGHWCFIFRWTCSPNVNTKCWVKFDSATCTLQTTFRSNNGARSGEGRGDACGLHVESLTRNESTCACPARSYWAMTSMGERKSKGCASVPPGGVLVQVLDRDAQHRPSTRNATRVKKGGSKLYILLNFDEKYGSKYDIFLIFAKI